MASANDRRRVLVVDDDARITDLLVTMLGNLGHTTTGALTREQALEAAGSFHPDVVLLDVTMPNVTGPDLLLALMRAAPQARVLVMTGDPARAAVLLEHGAVGYLTKPFRIETLAETLKKVVA
jgi:DNA-binding NtrC family response regulator